MSKSLQPGNVVGRFRVVSLLGAGGMGEVYLARDESLDRAVALKILPPELVRNDERVRRFVQEAKSASSLSHPNIVTIYEIGEADVPSTGSEQAAHVHFIAMELVQGSTLKDLIHTKKTDLRTLLRYLAQAAEGIAKAHAAGIVHRDLKPENIMVTDDGFAKVLDFGLAKLTEAGAGAGSVAETRTALASPTGAGMILGTIGYMSPEQVQAKPVDHRSDIFSFGCILYEAATRQRPFKADSDIETLHQIVKEKPTAVEELNAQAPADVRRLIRRCLAKAPEQRLQSMKDLAIELTEIAEQYDALPVAASSGGSASLSGAALGAPGRSLWEKIAIAAAVVIGVGGLAVGGWAWFSGRPASGTDATAFAKMEITRLASIADLGGAVMSPDARLLAYIVLQPGNVRVLVRQLATGRDVEVVAPGGRGVSNIQFSPDGNYLFYREGAGPQGPSLYQVASLGGQPRRINAPDIVGQDFAISPDGSQIAGSTADHQKQQTSLVIVNLDGTPPRILTTFKVGGGIGNLTWSPDGRYIVGWPRVLGPGNAQGQLVEISVKDGAQRSLGSDVWAISDLSWLPDGSGLIAIGRDPGEDNRQVWLVSWPDGARRRITNDASNYMMATVSADSRSIATVTDPATEAYWIAPAGNLDAATRLGSTGGTLVSTRSGAVMFTRAERGRASIWSVSANGAAPRRLTPERLNADQPYPAALADVVVFTSTADDRSPSMWRMDMDGGGLAEIPDGRNRVAMAISPDGRTVLFSKPGGGRNNEAAGIWSMPVAGGAEVKFADYRNARPTYSPDGKYLFRLPQSEPGARAGGGRRGLGPGRGRGRPSSLPSAEAAERGPARREIVLVESGKLVRTLEFLRNDGHFQWAPSSDAIMVNRTTNGVDNIWRVPIDGRPAQQLTRFGAGVLSNYYAWTADGSHLVFRKNDQGPNDVLLIKNFR